MAELVEPLHTPIPPSCHQQTIAVGPAASQIAIKQLGTNGGGFFNANSAHPFENPTPVSNFLEMLAILLIPAALCEMFGRMVKDRRQGWVLLAAMTVILVPLTIAATASSSGARRCSPPPVLTRRRPSLQAGGNMEGKETRFGIVNSAIWASATTAASNGSVNAMHDSFTPLGGMIPMWLIQFGEVVFGGVGSGLYGMLVFALIAVFIAGLMVGRTPEYLGKKIEAYEMKMASLVILIPAMMILFGTAARREHRRWSRRRIQSRARTASVRCSTPSPRRSATTAARSAASGPIPPSTTCCSASACGSAASGLRFPCWPSPVPWPARSWCPPAPARLPTHTPLFAGLLVGTVLLVGALTFVPALALGPIVEHLQLLGR